MSARRDRRGGFTLPEVLMVVIVIAILSALVMPQYVRVSERGRTGQVLQLMGSLRSSELRYKAQTGAYSTDVDVLDLGTLPTMASWAAPTVSGTGDGANLRTARVGGTYNGATLEMDLNAATVCASTSAAAVAWGVGDPGC